MEGIDRRLRMVLLNDLYGQLMTDKRSEALRLYLEEDLSLAEIAASATVIGLQLWKRNPLLSILAGTAVYMILVQTVVP